MITGKWEYIAQYKSVYASLTHLLNEFTFESLQALNEKVEHDLFALIPIYSHPKEVEVSTLLEAHKKYVDVHITFQGTDIMGYADLLTESVESKPYDENNDYLLVHSTKIKLLNIPKGYFCIVPNEFAHMALYNIQSEVQKIVVKLAV